MRRLINKYKKKLSRARRAWSDESHIVSIDLEMNTDNFTKSLNDIENRIDTIVKKLDISDKLAELERALESVKRNA